MTFENPTVNANNKDKKNPSTSNSADRQRERVRRTMAERVLIQSGEVLTQGFPGKEKKGESKEEKENKDSNKREVISRFFGSMALNHEAAFERLVEENGLSLEDVALVEKNIINKNKTGEIVEAYLVALRRIDNDKWDDIEKVRGDFAKMMEGYGVVKQEKLNEAA